MVRAYLGFPKNGNFKPLNILIKCLSWLRNWNEMSDKKNKPKQIINRIVDWAQKEKDVRAVILMGSRAAGMEDPYSDFDLAIFCSSYDSYSGDEGWLSNIGNVWVCVHEKVNQGNHTFPTRLVIFEGGEKVDFGFYPMNILHDLVHAKDLPDEYNRGYTVLVDKRSLTALMPKATHKESAANQPSEPEFQRIINEFWFEVHHVAKYLKRDDLWSVKFRSGSIYDNFLLKMIEWNEQAKLNWKTQLPPLGKRMRSWVDPDTWKSLHQVFAHFDRSDSRRGLLHLIELFRKIATDTANRLGYSYPYDLDKNITNHIKAVLEGV